MSLSEITDELMTIIREDYIRKYECEPSLSEIIEIAEHIIQIMYYKG